MRFYTLIAVLLLSFTGYGQRCHTDQYQKELDKSYQYRAKRMFRSAVNYFNNKKSRTDNNECANRIIIPVVVHFYDIPEGLRDCAIKSVEDQLSTLNADFKALNQDLSNWATVSNLYPNVLITESCIDFVLANHNHPTGFGLIEGEGAIVFHNLVFNDFEPKFNDYFNIFVGNIENGVLGYSPLGGWGNGDGVAVGLDFFSSSVCGQFGSAAPYNKGRTLVHEAGHYFNLSHIWGNGCEIDDGIADTPDQLNSNGGCPINTSSCGSVDLHMNYMDYVDDACMYMFTDGQTKVMEDYVLNNLGRIIEKGKSVIKFDVIVIEPIDSNFVDSSLLDSVVTDSVVTDSTVIDSLPVDTSDITPIDTVVNPIDTILNPPDSVSTIDSTIIDTTLNPVDTSQVNTPVDIPSVSNDIPKITFILLGLVIVIGLVVRLVRG